MYVQLNCLTILSTKLGSILYTQYYNNAYEQLKVIGSVTLLTQHWSPQQHHDVLRMIITYDNE